MATDLLKAREEIKAFKQQHVDSPVVEGVKRDDSSVESLSVSTQTLTPDLPEVTPLRPLLSSCEDYIEADLGSSASESGSGNMPRPEDVSGGATEYLKGNIIELVRQKELLETEVWKLKSELDSKTETLEKCCLEKVSVQRMSAQFALSVLWVSSDYLSICHSGCWCPVSFRLLVSCVLQVVGVLCPSGCWCPVSFRLLVSCVIQVVGVLCHSGCWCPVSFRLLVSCVLQVVGVLCHSGCWCPVSFRLLVSCVIQVVGVLCPSGCWCPVSFRLLVSCVLQVVGVLCPSGCWCPVSFRLLVSCVLQVVGVLCHSGCWCPVSFRLLVSCVIQVVGVLCHSGCWCPVSFRLLVSCVIQVGLKLDGDLITRSQHQHQHHPLCSIRFV